MPERPSTTLQPVFLYRPCFPKCTGDLAPRELVNALTHARARRVPGRRDVAVVAEIVVYREMAVCRYRENDLGQPFLDSRILVAEFMARIDCETGRQAGDERKPECAGEAEITASGIPAGRNQHDNMQWHGHVGEPPIVGVPVHLHDNGLGRVVAVLAEQPVENRPEAEIQCQGQQ